MKETLDVLFYIISEINTLYKNETFNFKTKAKYETNCKTLNEFVDSL